MKIILGVFNDSFRNLKATYNLESFDYGWPEYPMNEHYNKEESLWGNPISDILSKIRYACEMAEEIYFDVTHIAYYLDNHSFSRYTVNELLLVITDLSYLAKTRFFRDGIEIPKDEVVNWFLFNEYWNQFFK